MILHVYLVYDYYTFELFIILATKIHLYKLNFH